MQFFQRIERRAKEINSLLCVGLDPHLELLPSPTSDSLVESCKRLVDKTSDIAVAYKPNSAFFEQFGSQGLAALEKVIEYIPDQVPIILDAKRGDIASSAQAYARAAFEAFKVDAITINPYLGYDAIAPFIQDEQYGVFLLCKTSNPGSNDLQDLAVMESSDQFIAPPVSLLYESIAAKAAKWNKKGNLGLVVGATQIKALRRVRDLAPDLWILAPGVGAQGGDLEQALEAGLRDDSSGMIIPVSRAISQAEEPHQAALLLKDRINKFRESFQGSLRQVRSQPIEAEVDKRLAIEILRSGCVEFGEFTLKSGLSSPIYIDLRRLIAFPGLLNQVGQAFSTVLRRLEFDHLAAVPYAGVPIATATSLVGGWSLVYPRKESKTYGTRAEVEGVFSKGQRVVLIDDLATTGGSKFEAIEKLNAVGLHVTDVVVLIDRESGAGSSLSEHGIRMHAIYKLTELVSLWLEHELITSDQVRRIQQFLQNTK